MLFHSETIIIKQHVTRENPFKLNNQGFRCHEPSLAADMVSRTLRFFDEFCLPSHGGHKCRQLWPSMFDSPEMVCQCLAFPAKMKWKMKSKPNSLKHRFGLLIHTIVTPILVYGGTWCSKQLFLFQRDEKIKPTEEKNLLFWYT